MRDKIFKTRTNKAGRYKALLGAASMLALSSMVHAAEQAQSIHLEAQPLEKALVNFSRQTGVVVFAPAEIVSGISAPALSGTLTAEVALRQMLAGTGLKAMMNADGSYVVTEAEKVGSSASGNEGEATSFVLEEIIVTATRRAASMQDIPMSVAAYTGNILEQRGVDDVYGLQFLAPGMHLTGGPSGITKMALRGIGSDQGSIGAESGAALHRDGVYIPSTVDIRMGFFDVERVEVLKGPQGTLYGRNATGGAINIISKSPTKEFEGGATVTYGNYNFVETKGYVSGPLIGDKLMARVAFKTSDYDGYTPNIYNGESLDNGDFAGVRAKLRYEATEDIRLDVTAEYAQDSGIPATIYKRSRSGAPLPFETEGGVLPDGRAVNKNSQALNDKETWGVIGKLVWDMQGATLSSLTAYRNFNWAYAYDSDGGSTSLIYYKNSSRGLEQLSQELTLASAGESALEWIVGGFYFHSKETEYADVPFTPLSRRFITPTDNYTTNAYAVFGEASYPVLEKLTLTVGARYSYEEKVIEGASLTTAIDDVTAIVSETLFALEDNWGSFTPKVALTYQVNDDVTAYATIGKGFKAGGYNGVAGNSLGAFDPEKVTNYEIGLKTSLLDGRLRADIAAFHMDYSDLQVRIRRIHPESGLLVSGTQNAATSKIRGVEMKLQAQPTESLVFDAGLSYLDAAFDDYPNANDNIFGIVDASGFQMPNAPKWAVNLGVDYTIPVGSWGSATLHADYAYKSRVFFNTVEDTFRSQDGANLFNARVTFEDVEGRWTLAGWVRNLTDEQVISFRDEILSASSGPRAPTTYLAPRTYGLTVGYRF